MEYRLHTTWVKLDDNKPMTVGVGLFSIEEVAGIVKPYSDFISTQPGFLNVYSDKTDNTYETVFVVDTEANARTLFNTLTDDNISEIKKMKDLVKAYIGDTDYRITWSLRKLRE